MWCPKVPHSVSTSSSDGDNKWASVTLLHVCATHFVFICLNGSWQTTSQLCGRTRVLWRNRVQTWSLFNIQLDKVIVCIPPELISSLIYHCRVLSKEIYGKGVCVWGGGGDLVAMTTPEVRQPVNNSGLAHSWLKFVLYISTWR